MDGFGAFPNRRVGEMSENQSITCWIEKLREGDPRAAQKVWERYFRRLVQMAHRKLQGFPRRAADEEDVAVSAFHSFCAGVAAGRFPQLDDRDDLWQILVTLAGWKARDLRKREHAAKRGGGRLRGESVFQAASETAPNPGIAQVAGDEPTPEFAAIVAEEYQRLLDQLGDDTLRQIALRKLEGYTNEEIAEQLGCVVRTVERKLGYIRAIWNRPEA
jgi:DNA-directed RNA polymerase specialized sigma24 family protein